MPDAVIPDVDVMIDPHKHVWCARHGEPFRARYPKGFPVATIQLFQKVFEQEGFWDLVVEKTGLEKPEPKDALPLFEERRCCCRVGKQVLLELYTAAEIGTVARCKNCRRDRLGTRYQVSHGWKVKKLRHLCFDCVLNGLVEH